MRNRQEGIVFVLFALLLIPLMVFFAISVDLVRIGQIRTQLQRAADTAALSMANARLAEGYSSFLQIKNAHNNCGSSQHCYNRFAMRIMDANLFNPGTGFFGGRLDINNYSSSVEWDEGKDEIIATASMTVAKDNAYKYIFPLTFLPGGGTTDSA